MKSDHLLAAVNQLAETLSQRYDDHQRERFTVEDRRDHGPHGGAVLLLNAGTELGSFQNLQQVNAWNLQTLVRGGIQAVHKSN